LPITGLRHEIKKGDTVNGIAKKYKGDVSDILAYNGISPEGDLTIGDVIFIPDGELVVAETNYTINSVTKKREKLYGTNAPAYTGYYLRPISGGRKTQGLHGYNGVDLAAPTGTAIVAAADGVVILNRTGWGGGYGNHIAIAHDNGTQTLYAHNSKNLVTVGEHVNQGQTIALIGSTGRSTGPHVHFEVRGAKNPF
jgi:murein DD-endopeptidase MepM/ murein hydrolase activator NlpD